MIDGIGIKLRNVREEDVAIFFEQQLDPVANHMAAFTAEDPADRQAFEDHWRRILADSAITIKTIMAGGAVVGHKAFANAHGSAVEEFIFILDAAD